MQGKMLEKEIRELRCNGAVGDKSMKITVGCCSKFTEFCIEIPQQNERLLFLSAADGDVNVAKQIQLPVNRFLHSARDAIRPRRGKVSQTYVHAQVLHVEVGHEKTLATCK